MPLMPKANPLLYCEDGRDLADSFCAVMSTTSIVCSSLVGGTAYRLGEGLKYRGLQAERSKARRPGRRTNTLSSLVEAGLQGGNQGSEARTQSFICVVEAC
jgi:hypothetical protein